MTAVITFGPLMLVLGGMVAVTWPDVNVGLMFAVLAVLAVVLPFVTYGPSYCIWQAIDIVLRPPEPDDFEIVGDMTLDIEFDVDPGSGSPASDHGG